MSLVCNECGKEMRPSESLPGREGMLVHPVVRALIYVPSKSLKRPSYEMEYMMSQANRSLCFECVEEKLPKGRKSRLNQIYECYKAETEYKKIKDKHAGKWVPISDSSQSDAFHDLERKFIALEENCLFCGGDVEKWNKPFFYALAIDKVYSSKNLSGLFQGTNYSFSSLEVGDTYLKFCFDDFRKHFPANFEQLSYDMSRKKNPNRKQGGCEFYISQDIVDECSQKDGKAAKLLGNLMKESNVKIIKSEGGHSH
jgi:hypothetical protein